ncbi:MAG TPA: hypothetical protein VLE89_04010 [Chlamydiales bacterium]|nr:hypothetical protein [Chlamydiales bacterium]
MKHYWFWLICFSGCMGNDGLRTDAVSDNNTRNLSRISEGMVECEIVYIMGKPFEYRTFEAEGSVYDIWFYIVRPTVLGQTRMVHQNLVPLTFKDGVLIGWGYHYYQKALAMQKAKTAVEPETMPESEKPEEENTELEKALQTPPNQTPVAPQKTTPNQTAPVPQKTTPNQTAPAPQKTPPQPVKKSPAPPTTLGQLPGRDPNQDEPAAIQTQRQPTPVQPNQPPKSKTPVQPNPKPAVKPNQTVPKPPLQPNQPVKPNQSAPNQQPKPQPPANPKQKISMAKKPEQESEEPKEEAPQVDEEGNRMLDQESEQDFDFW